MVKLHVTGNEVSAISLKKSRFYEFGKGVTEQHPAQCRSACLCSFTFLLEINAQKLDPKSDGNFFFFLKTFILERNLAARVLKWKPVLIFCCPNGHQYQG